MNNMQMHVVLGYQYESLHCEWLKQVRCMRMEEIIFSFVTLLMEMNLTQSISSEKIDEGAAAHHRD